MNLGSIWGNLRVGDKRDTGPSFGTLLANLVCLILIPVCRSKDISDNKRNAPQPSVGYDIVVGAWLAVRHPSQEYREIVLQKSGESR